MKEKIIYADFNNADRHGRLRLNCHGSVQSISQHGVTLHEGDELLLHDEELQVRGVAIFSLEEHIWVAIIDWQQVEPMQEEFCIGHDNITEERTKQFPNETVQRHYRCH